MAHLEALKVLVLKEQIGGNYSNVRVRSLIRVEQGIVGYKPVTGFGPECELGTRHQVFGLRCDLWGVF